MAHAAVERAEVIRYLLGECSEEERLRVESAYFGNEESYQALLEAEDELACRWPGGELSRAQREVFRKRLLLSAAGREKAAFGEALNEVLGRLHAGLPANEPRKSGWRVWSFDGWLPVAATLSLLVVGWQFIQMQRLRVQIGALNARFEAERHRADTASNAARVAVPPTVSFLLVPGLTRGAEQLQRLQVPSGAAALRLQLLVTVHGQEAAPYRATLSTATGSQIWGQTGLRPSLSGGSRVVELVVPAALLINDEYDLLLQPGGQLHEAVTYHFAVTR